MSDTGRAGRDAPTLGGFLDAWLGQWPPQLPLDVVASERRATPGRDDALGPLLGVWAPEVGCVLSIPPDGLDAVELLGGLEPGVLTDPAWVGALAQAIGRPGARLRARVLRAVERPEQLTADAELGTWVSRDDPALPAWLRPFDAPEALVSHTDAGELVGGVGIQRHDPTGAELAVVVEPGHRGRGTARQLVATAARRVLAEGRVALYLHDPGDEPAARLADAVGFHDRGWRIVDLAG